MWRDELFSVFATLAPFEETLGHLIRDRVHPPLYYLLLFLWVKLGYSEFILRLFSVVWGVLTIPVLYRLAKRVGGHTVGLIGAFLLAVSPFHIWFSQEVRMHTLVVFAITASGWFLLRLADGPSRLNWLGYSASIATAVYTHYFALLVLASHALALAANAKTLPALWHKFIRQAILIGILFAAWASLVLLNSGAGELATGNVGWIGRPHWYEPLLTLVAFSTGSTIDQELWQNYINAIIFFACLIVAFITTISPRLANKQAISLHGQAHFRAQVLWSWLLFPILITWLVSLRGFPLLNISIYMDRNLIVVLPAMLVLVACGLFHLTKKRPLLLWAALIVIGVMNGQALQQMFQNPDYHREDWRGALRQINHDYQPGDQLFMPFGTILPWWYYGEGIPYQVRPREFDETDFSRQVTEIAAETPRLWLLSFSDNTNPHGFPAERNAYIAQIYQRDPFAAWLVEHYNLAAQWTYAGIRVGLYDLRLP
ncbi:MAG: glycosyltransferase family 39 protein [Chloroflexi bacterium]|nr:glycosyltransferase family 39 protein [Chloroflexota bacterium]